MAWKLAFLGMAVLVLVGIVTTIVATEPQQSAIADAAHAGEKNSVMRVAQAAYHAFADFLTRDAAIVVLLFVVLYKFCDAFAGAMTAAFVIKIGFSIVDYANIVKGVGLAATLIGGFAGGALATRYSMVTCLWIGAILQMVSNLAFTWLALVGTNHWALVVAIIAENFAGAIGTVIFVAYLSALCQSPLHTATQFALLTALAAVGRTYLLRRRRHRRGSDRLADVLRGLVAGRDPEPVAARLAAAARAFCELGHARPRELGTTRRWSLRALGADLRAVANPLLLRREDRGSDRRGRIRCRRCSPACPSSRSS